MGVKALNHGFGGLPGFGNFGRQAFGSATRVSVSYETRNSGSRGYGEGFGHGGAKGFSGGRSATSLRASDGYGRTRGYDSFRNFGDFGNARGFHEFGRNSGGKSGKGFGGFNHFSNLAQNKAFGGLGGFGAPSFGRASGFGGGFQSGQSWGGDRGLSGSGGYRSAEIYEGYDARGGFQRHARYEGYGAQNFGGFGAQNFGGFGAQNFGGFGAQNFGECQDFGGGRRAAPTTSYDVAFDPSASAGYDNAVGVYEVTPRGDLVNARLLAPSAHDAEGGTTTIDGVRPGNKLGFFIVQNAADWAEKLGSGDKLSFRAEDGSRANLADGSPILAVNGKPVDQTTYHSFGASLNPDGLKHAIKNTNGRDSGTIAFEDLDFGGDRDFDDVILHVQPNRNRFWG